MEPSIKILPVEIQPEYWNDESRMNALFGPFRSKTVNSKDWDYKYQFWKQLINKYCVHCKVHSFKLEDLKKAFNRDGRTPACLLDVVNEMERSKELQRVEDFSELPSNSWSGWAADVMLKKPMRWSFNKLKSSVVTEEIVDKTFVNIESLKAESEILLNSIAEDSRHKLFDIKDLSNFENFQVAGSSNLLLHYLVSSEKCSVMSIDNSNFKSTLIKFRRNKSDAKITEKEIDLYTLERTEKLISKNIEKMECEVQMIVKEAKCHLIKGHRLSAKTCLKKKREFEKRIESRSTALFNVQTLLLRLQDTEQDGFVIGSYKQALTSLRTSFKDGNLNEDAVANTMSEIAEVLDIHDDVQSSLSAPVREEDEDLEAELAELLASDNTSTPPKDSSSPKANATTNDSNTTVEIEEQLGALKLPDVPQHNPGLDITNNATN